MIGPSRRPAQEAAVVERVCEELERLGRDGVLKERDIVRIVIQEHRRAYDLGYRTCRDRARMRRVHELNIPARKAVASGAPT